MPSSASLSTQKAAKPTKSHTTGRVGISTSNLLLASAMVMVFAIAYSTALLIALPVFPIFVALGAVIGRTWHARRAELEYGLVRRPLGRS